MIVDLCKNWRMHDAPLDWDKSQAPAVLAFQDGWHAADLPCDVHMPLIKAGIMRDPVKADYSYESQWIEKRSWWFLRQFDSFDVPDCDVAELEIDSLDACADIFLNGAYIGSHNSAHYPFVKDIASMIAKGTNTLLVRVSSGLEHVDDSDLAGIGWNVGVEGDRRPDRGDMRRAFVRKPQYVYGWDWDPRVASIGIMKGARISCKARIAIKGAGIFTESVASGTAILRAIVEVQALPKVQTIDGRIKVELLYEGRVAACGSKNDLLLCAGSNFVNMELAVSDAKLWWPNGVGAQPLYEVRITAESAGVTAGYPVFHIGIRTVELDTSRAIDGGRLLRIVVNGVPVMCKGGNWIPSDSIYARVTDEKYCALVREAAQANFNMLRVWGGGIYERDAFYDACDEYGILVWHDFMFSCSAYPDHLDWFCREVEWEIDYQTKRLRNRACLALWCGNNESQWLIGAMCQAGASLGLRIYNTIAPELVRKNCPQIPYWPSSPFGGGEPNSSEAGDRHIWLDFMMNEDMEKRITPEEYDKVEARFVSEYGFPGPAVRESIEEYFDGMPIDRSGRIWDLHNNTFEKDTVSAGIRKHYTSRELNLDDYLLYASLVQSLMLEYSLEAIRIKPECFGALFWMYNDCWGEVGWSIIDYYLRRKPSWYAVKRSFEPVLLALRTSGAGVSVTACNDTADDVAFEAEAGWFPLDGSKSRLERVSILIPAHSRGIVLKTTLGEGDPRREVWAVWPLSAELRPAILRLCTIREMAIADGNVTITGYENYGDDLLITVHSDMFAHAVHFNLGDARMSDQYFDMLPGESRTVQLYGFAGKSVGIAASCVLCAD